MSSVNPLTPDKKAEILRHINDVGHEQLKDNNIIVLARHSKEDPRKFEIVADSAYDKKLEGVMVIFDNIDQFKEIFPEFSQPPPINNPPNTEPNPDTGTPVGQHKDPYVPVKVLAMDGNNKLAALTPEYKPENAIDGDMNTIFGIKQLNAKYFLDFGKPVELGGLWIAWSLGDERQFKFSVAYSNDGKSFQIVKNLKSKYSGGKTKDDFESYALSSVDTSGKPIPLTARFLMIQGEGNSKNLNWFSIAEIKATKAKPVKSFETSTLIYEDVWKTEKPEEPDRPTEPDKPTEPEPDRPTPDNSNEPANWGKDVYPLPPNNRKYQPEIAAKNTAKLLSGKLPLLSRMDKNGTPYTDLDTLISQLQLPIKRSYNYNHENYNPRENNNDGDENGKSLRCDFKEYMPQCEMNITMLNRSKVNEQFALKYGGTHSSGSDDIWADCFIVRLHMNGKLIEMQFEPRHMAPDPFGYGEKFNQIQIPANIVGDTKNKKLSLRIIKLNDPKNKRVYCIWAIDKTGNSKDFDLLYLSTTYDGMGGERVLKDPYCQWAYHVKKDLSKCNITLRMDGQQNYNLKRGDNYDHPRCTEIVGLES